MESKMSGKAGFEVRGGVKPLAFVYRRLELLARCHLFSRQATRKSGILYWHIQRLAFILALWPHAKNKRYDLCLIASHWVVATQVRASLTYLWARI